MLTETEFLVFNAVYLKKMVAAPQIVEMTGIGADDVARCLEDATTRGWVMDMGADGVMVLDDGATEVLKHYAEAYVQQRKDPAMTAWYHGFEALNLRFIAAVTQWQESDGDSTAERRLLQAAERLAKDIALLMPAIPRYAGYVGRLESSMEKVDLGERDFVCNPTVDSVHNVWFEFHEDILTVLGRKRDTT